MELRDYLRILWGRRWLIVLCMAVAAGSALAFSARVTPLYSSTAKVFVGPRSVEQDDVPAILQELTASQQYVTSYSEMLKSRPLAEIVIEKTQAPITPTELTESTETQILPDTRLIAVTVTDPSPARAQQYANQMVTSFIEDERNQFGGGGAITASVFEEGLKPDTPVSPKPVQNGIIGGLLGLMLGVGVAFVLEQLDTTLRSKEDVERVLAPIPVIATIPLAPYAKDRTIFMETDLNSPQAEAIRILRTNIQFVSVDRPVTRVLVTSPFAGDGKTTVAINLAVSMAAVGSSVMLIETDLRKPVLARTFEGGHTPGLSDVLSGQASVSQAIRRTRIPNLSIIVAGPTPPNPSELLGSERMADLIDSVSNMVDMVILDTPPALPVTDATVLAPHTDGVILVVRSGQTNANKALDVTKTFERHEVRMLGVAINGVDREIDGGYYYQYTSYDQPRGSRRKGRDDDLRGSDFDDLMVGNITPAHRQTPSSRPAARPPRQSLERSPARPPAPAHRPSRPEVKPPPRRTGRTADEARNAAFRAKLRSSIGDNSEEEDDPY